MAYIDTCTPYKIQAALHVYHDHCNAGKVEPAMSSGKYYKCVPNNNVLDEAQYSIAIVIDLFVVVRQC